MIEQRAEQIVPAPIGGAADGSDPSDHTFTRLKLTPEDDADWVMPGVPKHYFLPRVMSLGMLGVVAFCLIEGARAGYLLYTDALVAPFVLSKDSEQVTSSRLSLAGLLGDRDNVAVRIDITENSMHVDRESITQLRELRSAVSGGLAYSGAVVSQNESAAGTDRERISDQRTLLWQSVDNQRAYVKELERQMSAGLVRRSDVAREENELRRLQLLELQNQREQVGAETRRHEIELMRQSLSTARPAANATAPDVLRYREQLLRIELELISLDADLRGKLAELEAAKAQAQRLDRLIDQIKSRPVYRAIEEQQFLAFVPYTQLDQVTPDAALYECRLWSAFDCVKVGRVLEVLPGEVVAQDPWGSPARGQYAVMDLVYPRAANAKVLRVRRKSQPKSSFANDSPALLAPTPNS
ncbi:MAG TPA: hypothetical protein VFG30_26735 [Polyangiales bacterium]|nr:hypothetical protein [Polyangiales bacterium]